MYKALKIDPDLHQQVVAVSRQTGISIKRIVEDAIRQRLETLDDQGQPVGRWLKPLTPKQILRVEAMLKDQGF